MHYRGSVILMTITVNEFMRRAALEKIENELDIRAAGKAYAEYPADPAAFSHEAMGRLPGLSKDAGA